MENSKAVINITGLQVRRGIRILDGVNWYVKKGQHWVILGANGSGKTALLNTLTAYLTPSAGTIEVCGSMYGRADWREVRKKIGFVSSSILQKIDDPETALETVVSGKNAMLNYWGEINETDIKKARKILKQVECEHLADRPWLYLSQGERQRICIGRALMSQFCVLLLDEPCAGLDPVARENFLSFIERMAQKRTTPTLALVTHHVEEITPSFSHVLVMKSGRILASGEKARVLNSAVLSDAFHAPILLRKVRTSYKMTIKPKRNVIV